jgi:hypothetical protein
VDVICRSIYPRFQDSASPDFKFFMMLPCFTFITPESYQDNQEILLKMAKETIDHYWERCSSVSAS